MYKQIFAFSCTALFCACTTGQIDSQPIPPIHQIESRNNLGGTSNDPAKMQAAIQEATELCNKQGKKIVIVDTRTSAYKQVGALAYGDIKYVCAPE